MTPYMDAIVQNMLQELEAKKEKLVKEKLIEKGYPEIASNMGTARFPRIAIVRQGDWDYYLADNGTPGGVFVVAIKHYEFIDSANLGNEIRIHFQWQDKHPPVEYKPQGVL